MAAASCVILDKQSVQPPVTTVNGSAIDTTQNVTIAITAKAASNTDKITPEYFAVYFDPAPVSAGGPSGAKAQPGPGAGTAGASVSRG